MKSAPGFTLPRISLALTLSILLHSLLLWQWPKLDYPPHDARLPSLQAKLVPLPKISARPVTRKPAAKPSAIPETARIPAVASTPVIATEPIAASTIEESAAAALGMSAEPFSHPLLPKHAQLRFAVQYGSGTFKVGEVVHTLENIDGHYTLRAATQTTGLVSLFKNFHLSQTSMGAVSEQGLRPDRYLEIKTDGSSTQTSTAHFDWARHKISFNDGNEKALAEHAQDVLSLPYQLAQRPLNAEGIQIALSNGRNINQYHIALGEEGSISTAMGELRTVSLSKVHGANEEGLIIWLALEYRLLPVKILYLDKSGAVSANMLITDIRVSDE